MELSGELQNFSSGALVPQLVWSLCLGCSQNTRTLSSSGAFLRPGRNQSGYWNESTDIASLPPPGQKPRNTKSLHLLHSSACLTGSLCKHKFSIKFCFLQPKGLTRVCPVSLVCDVRSWTIRFKDVPGCRNHLLSHIIESPVHRQEHSVCAVKAQKKTSWKCNLLSAAGCCHEWQKQIFLGPVSGWEQTALQPDRSIKNCCSPQHGKDVADIDVSWYQPELKAWDVPASHSAMLVGPQSRDVLQLQRKWKLGENRGRKSVQLPSKMHWRGEIEPVTYQCWWRSPGLPLNFHLFSTIALRNVSWQHNTESSQRLNVLMSNETKPEISFLKDSVCYR